MARKAKIMVVSKPRTKKTKAEKEITRLGRILRQLGGLGGAVAGGYVGQTEGGRVLGTQLGAHLSRWLGSGAYKVAANTLLTPAVADMHTSDQTVRIRHKEYLGPITGSENFAVYASYVLNPSNAFTFPWLSRIAACYQQYSIKGAVFQYVPTSGVAISGTNPAIGAVMIQTSYRATDDAPVNKVEMLNEYWSSEGPPNETFVHPIECDPKENPFQIHYVGNPASDSDRLMYDLGKVFVATQGMPGSHAVGDLWLSYDIEFKKPIVRSSALPAQYEYGKLAGAATPTAPFSTMTTNTLPDNVTVLDNDAIHFGPGCQGSWVIVYEVTALTNFTVCDMGGTGVVGEKISQGSYLRNVLSGTTPSLNRAFRIDQLDVTDNVAVGSFIYPDFTLTPSTGLSYTCRVFKYA